MDGAEVLQGFEKRVEIFVANNLQQYDPANHAKEKSIRDTVWGTDRFYSWEVAIIDSPLLQRLRDIRQTGLAYLVYPTAVHTRFDHTLGMVTVTSRIVRSVNEKHPQLDAKIRYSDHMATRLSALLHDVGHSCLSHVSESVYGATDEFNALLIHVNELFGVTPKPHEVMSWLVVRSQRFKQFLEELKKDKILSGWECTAEDMEVIAGNIIGYRKNPADKFLADIVNGPMDADELDYLVRDAYFAGPTVVYDLERFLHTVDAITYPRDESLPGDQPNIVRLSVPIEGVTALEQIIISKLMLFSYLYHHQKIRCVEAMYHEALTRWVELSKKKPRRKGLPQLDHPACFLNLSDRSLLPAGWPPQIVGDKAAKAAGDIISMLTRRELFVRALIISRLFIPSIDLDPEAKSGFEKLQACGKNAVERDDLRQQILARALKVMASAHYREETKELRKRFQIQHIIVDIPKSPTVEETESVMIAVSPTADGDEKNFIPLSDVFPIEKWVDSYNAIKWRGHIFAIPDAAHFVNVAARDIFSKAPYNLKFTDQATELCKIRLPTSDSRSFLRGE